MSQFPTRGQVMYYMYEKEGVPLMKKTTYFQTNKKCFKFLLLLQEQQYTKLFVDRMCEIK